jgi:homoserine kinase
VHPTISAVVFVPREGVPTEVARGLLPESVPHREAAANAGRAALLVAALAGAPEMLLRATEDFLHQEQRGPAMPESLALVHRLRAAGVPAVISGAGPSVLAFVTRGSDQASVVLESGPSGWRTLPQAVGGQGATVLG